MAAPLKVDLKIDKGETFRIGFLFRKGGVPIDPTGYIFRIQARVAKTLGAKLILNLSTEALEDMETPAIPEGATLVWDENQSGQVNVILSRDQTRVPPEGKFFWEGELTTPDDESDILVEGSLKIVLGVIQ
jgi:hypothetical protein